MNLIKLITLSIACFCFVTSAIANQENNQTKQKTSQIEQKTNPVKQKKQNISEKDKLSLDRGTIDSQFEYVIKKSHNYQEFEVIKKTWMKRLRAHVNDSLDLAASKLANSNKEIDLQKAEILSLTNQLNETNAQLESTTNEKDSMSFFGILINKNLYNIIMWGIIAGISGLLFFFITRFNNSNMVTRQTRQEIEELNYEFDSFRKRALEREQVLARELQDERNKHLV